MKVTLMLISFESSGFDLTTRDLYFTILVENTHSSRKHTFHKSFRVNRTEDYGLKTSKQVQDYLTMS